MSLRGVPGSKEGADTVFAGVTGEGGGGVAHLKRLHRGVASTGGHQTEAFKLTANGVARMTLDGGVSVGARDRNSF